MNRFVEIPPKGLMTDLVWSDPTNKSHETWKFNDTRVCSYFYTAKQAKHFLRSAQLKMLIRAHEVQHQGFSYQECEETKVKTSLTLFSAPNYCDRYNNLGAVGDLTKVLFSTILE